MLKYELILNNLGSRVCNKLSINNIELIIEIQFEKIKRGKMSIHEGNNTKIAIFELHLWYIFVFSKYIIL